MMQTKTHSMLESLANTAIGYVVAIASQLVVFPLFDIHIPLQDNLLIGLWFTAISLARAYLVRRWFVGRTEAAMQSWQCVTGLGADCCCQRRVAP